MKIQILGSGCNKCNELFANVEKAVKENNIDCEIEKVSEIDKIVDMGVMVTPALAIDGKVISSGKVLSSAEIAEILSAGQSSCCCCCCSCEEEQKEETSCCCSEEKEDAPCCCSGSPKNGFLKKTITVLLLLFVVGSVLYIIDKENKPAKAAAAETIPADVLKVYYFHGAKRCMTCNTIEKLTEDAVGNSQKVKFLSVNVEEPQNEHFIKDFQLVNRTVVMERNGKFEKFDKVWNLVGSPEEFSAYIKEGVERLSK